MKQPMSLRWQSSSRYHTAMLTPDLFGGWVLVTTSGSRVGKGGRMRQLPLRDYAQGLEALRHLRHRRRLEGYVCREAGFSSLDHLDAHAADVRAAGALALLRVFRAWDVDEAEQAALLGLDAKGLGRLLDGCALADEPELLTRTRHLLAINKVLRLRFGHDADALRAWLRWPCPNLNGQAPLAAMLTSLASMARLRGQLSQASDRARGCERANAGS